MASSENQELLHEIYAGWERGDYTDASWASQEIEFEVADGPEPSIAHGLDAMAAAWGEMLRSWANWHAVPERFIEVDDERVLVFMHNTGRGRASGLEINEELSHSANLFHFRDGKVTRLIIYFDRDRALGDLGLPPEAELDPEE